MFNVGGPEVLVIAMAALIILGPQRLPGAIRQLGQVLGELRRISGGFQADVRGALAQAERDAEAEARQSPTATTAGREPDEGDPTGGPSSPGIGPTGPPGELSDETGATADPTDSPEHS